MTITIQLDEAPGLAAKSLRDRAGAAGRWGLDAIDGHWNLDAEPVTDRVRILEQAVEDYIDGKRLLEAMNLEGELTGTRRIMGQVVADALRDVAEDTLSLIREVADPITGQTESQVDRLSDRAKAIAYLIEQLEQVVA